MKKLIFLMLIMSPILLFGAIQEIEWFRVHLFEDPSGYDHEVWASFLRDTLIDTNYYGGIDTGWGDYYADTVRWTGGQYCTLDVITPIEVGEHNVFSMYLVSIGSPLDSFQIEYHPANVLADFVNIPWDWRIDTTYAAYTDSLIHRAVLCAPFFKWIKWRFIDQSTGGVDHLLRMYFSEKESG